MAALTSRPELVMAPFVYMAGLCILGIAIGRRWRAFSP
jgi:hypothetical protein